MKNLSYFLSKSTISVCLFLFFACLIHFNSFAQQLTQGITYQGKLIENGRPFSGSQTILFELIDNAGNIPWSETQTVNVQDGLYSVVLGNQTPLPSTVFTANPNLNLRVTVNGNILSPNVPLRATPYAHAAGSVIRNSIGTLQIIDGSVGSIDLADNSVTTPKIANDAVTSSKILNGSVLLQDLAINSIDSTKVINGSINSNDIADGTINRLDLADNTVTTDKIQNLTILDEDIAANADILGTKIIPNFGTQNISTTGKVTSAQTVGGDTGNTLTTKDYVDAQVSTATQVDGITIDLNGNSELEVVDNSISSAKIEDGTILNADLGTNSVTTPKINDNAITLAKLQDGTANQVFGTDASGNPILIDQTTFGAAINTDNQTLSFSGNTVSLTGDTPSSFDLSSTLPTTNDVLTWNGASWEAIAPSTFTNTDNQTLSLAATTVGTRDISITGGNTLALNIEDGDFDATNELQDLNLTSNILTIVGGALPTTSIDLTPYLDNTDNQTLSLTSTTPTTRQITITGGNTLALNIEDADSDGTNEIQDIAITGNSIGITGGTGFNLTPVAPTDGQVLTWNNGTTRWEAQTTTTSPFTVTASNVFRNNGTTEKFIFGSNQMNFTAGIDNRMFFDDATGAFRVGGTTGTQWDTRGNHSFAAGQNNIATGQASTVGGGSTNQATGQNTTVSGGFQNTATSLSATVGGGDNNNATANRTTIAGGSNSSASSTNSTVGGGFLNVASGVSSTVVGGQNLFARSYGEIAMGTFNTDYTPASTFGINTADRLLVVGNGTSGTPSNAMILYKDATLELKDFGASSPSNPTGRLYVEGGQLYFNGSPVGGGSSPFTVTALNVFRNVANEKFIFGSDQMNHTAAGANRMFYDKTTGAFRVGGTTGALWDTRGNFSFAAGQNTSAEGSHSTVSGGVGNLANFNFATVAGGSGNQANNIYATIAGGQFGIASGQFSFIGGGDDNQATGNYSVVAGGRTNLASGLYSTVAGGQLSSAEGDYSFTFGDANTGLADYATIIGHRIRTLATATGSVAIGDNAGATTTDISTANRFHARFANGYLFGTSVNGLGNIDDGVVITGGINPPTVGIRTLTPNTSFALDVNGIIRTTGAVNTTSDRRLKEKIFTLSGSLSNIQKLRGTRYFLKDKASDNRLQFGVIAQEVETVFPNLVMTDSEGYKSVSYSGLIPVLIEATKEQQTIIEAQQEKISKLEIQVQELKELVLLLKDENDSNSTLSKKVDALEKQLTSLVNQLSELTAQK